MKRVRILIWSVVFALLISSVGYAVLLTDPELYFDPGTLVEGYYVRIQLDDLSVDDDYLWAGGIDPVVDVDILPVLKENIYPPGYVYSQADYHEIPNIDYQADLTGG